MYLLTNTTWHYILEYRVLSSSLHFKYYLAVMCVCVLNCLKLFADLTVIYICAYLLNQKIEERNIRKENVGKRKEKESDQMLLTAIKERGIQIEGTGEKCMSLK